MVAITGASRGLGAALAEGFARAGASVAICATGADALRTVASRVEALGARCVADRVDVTDADAVADWIARATTELGAPSVLINNASVLGGRSPLAEYPVSEWREVLEVNLTGTLIVSRAVLPAMMEADDGSIINVSSGASIPPRTRWGAYGVSKAALDAFSINLARELSGTNVRVNVVDPGGMRTGMRAAAYPEEEPRTLKEPLSIVPLFLWLASDEARDVTGTRFQADEWLSARA